MTSVAVTRTLGPLVLDAWPQRTIQEILWPSTRDLQRSQMPFTRRTTRVREDTTEAVLEVRGFWRDMEATRYRDFEGALLNQRQALLDLGDGQVAYSVDVLDVVGSRLTGVQDDSGGQQWAYVAKLLSYEPYAREVAPLLSADQALATGAGAVATSWDVHYRGSAPGEPTWQFTLVVPAIRTVTQVALTNALTGQTCTVGGLALSNGTYVVLMDASGGSVGRTPDNSGYGLLTLASPGRGASAGALAGPLLAVDFSGNVPGLQEARGLLPPLDSINHMTATITADGAITSAKVNWLAPARFYRA